MDFVFGYIAGGCSIGAVWYYKDTIAKWFKVKSADAVDTTKRAITGEIDKLKSEV